MKILALTNLYPPHHAGTFDIHAQSRIEALRTRGHELLVLTSTHGLNAESRDASVWRALTLNGVFGAPLVTAYNKLKALEFENHQALNDAIATFQPELILIFSLTGISKSFTFSLRNGSIPVVYDVYDHWLTRDVELDPWLRFWNAPSLPFFEQSTRTTLEMSGERSRVDATAPTRIMKGYDRIPGLYGEAKARLAVTPNSIANFRFDHIYFCSRALKEMAECAGFPVSHGEVIHPCITGSFFGEVKPASKPMTRFLIVSKLSGENGIMTALEAVKLLRAARINLSLHIYGRGESNFVAKLRSFTVTNQLPVEFNTVSNLNTDMAAIYKKHDVLLHTPQWPEPFPMTALEAMGCGLPVIGAQAGGAADLLRHGENALVFPPGDAAQLASRIQELLVSPALRRQMAETAQADVMENYNDSTVLDQLENYLNASVGQTQ